MILIKTADEIERMREVCFIAATVLEELIKALAPGLSTYDLDQMGKALIESKGAESACYRYAYNNKVFPGYICVSVNEEVVHGIGSPSKILKAGDIVSLDVSVKYRGFVGDTARTAILQPAPPERQRLLDVTQEALQLGIQQAKAEKRVGDISHAIQSFVEGKGYTLVKEFVGHGIGRSMHEEPQIPNIGLPHTGPKLLSGMTLAIEPMVNMGKSVIDCHSDGWTIRTRDLLPSAHFEHTILVKEGEPEILTLLKK